MKRLLIINTNLDLETMLQLYFQADYEVKSLSTGESGLLEARAWLPDVILVNDPLSDKPANDVCQDLLNHPATNHIPIILLMGEVDRRTKLAALEVGIDAIVTRPFDIEELKLRVESVIRLASYRADISD